MSDVSNEMEAHVDMLLEAKPLLLKPNTLFVMTLKCVAGHLDSSCDSQVQKQVSRLDQVAYGVKTIENAPSWDIYDFFIEVVQNR